MFPIWATVLSLQGFPGSSDDKASACKETQVPFLGLEDPLEKGMATHSSILAWRIPWKEELSGLSVRHDWVTHTTTSIVS